MQSVVKLTSSVLHWWNPLLSVPGIYHVRLGVIVFMEGYASPDLRSIEDPGTAQWTTKQNGPRRSWSPGLAPGLSFEDLHRLKDPDPVDLHSTASRWSSRTWGR